MCIRDSNKTFAGIIEYRPSVQVASVDSDSRIVRTTTGSEFQASVLNVIPTHLAGSIVRTSGLVPDLTAANWGAPVNPLNYESTVSGMSGVHIIGDSQGTGMSKGGHVANGEAKVCADAILRMLKGEALDMEPVSYTHLDVYKRQVLPRLANLASREADLAITLERPRQGPYVVARWSDSTYFLYGSKDYLVTHLPIRTHADSMTICSVRNCGFWMKNCDQPKLHFCSASMLSLIHI